jgi:hypothetical protein
MKCFVPLTTQSPPSRRAAGHAAHVRSRAGLRHGQRIHPLAPHRREQVFLLLLALAGHQDVLRPPEEMRQRHGPAAKLALHQREVEMPEAAAADLLGEVAGVEPHLDDLALDLLRELWRHLAGALHEVLVRIDLGLDEVADRRDDHLLFGAQREIHGILPDRPIASADRSRASCSVGDQPCSISGFDGKRFRECCARLSHSGKNGVAAKRWHHIGMTGIMPQNSFTNVFLLPFNRITVEVPENPA